MKRENAVEGIKTHEAVCAVCSEKSKQISVLQADFGETEDLDGRPSEEVLKNIVFWRQECPFCGYACEDISVAMCEISPKNLQDLYKTALSGDEPKEVRAFIKCAALFDYLGKNGEATREYVRASWVYGELIDKQSANSMRAKALDSLKKHFKVIGEWSIQNSLWYLLYAELLRLSGRFDEVLCVSPQKNIYYADLAWLEAIRYYAKTLNDEPQTTDSILEHSEPREIAMFIRHNKNAPKYLEKEVSKVALTKLEQALETEPWAAVGLKTYYLAFGDEERAKRYDGYNDFEAKGKENVDD